MALRLEQILTEGIAQISYLIGDDSTGTAAVIDPRPDVDIYLRLAREYGLSITHVFETHIHADFVSGIHELVDRLGGSAQKFVSAEGGAKYGFKYKPVHDRDGFEFGQTILTARHTPGHTPEHMSYVASEKGKPEAPFAVFTGDSLFVNSAGRPDLLGDKETDTLVKQLHQTLFDFYMGFDDGVIIYPGHGHGSACGADIGDRLSSTIGHERQGNAFLKHKDPETFREYVLSTAPPTPTYYPHMKKVNAAGAPVIGRLPPVPAMPPNAFGEAIASGKYVLIDTRSMLAFGGAHIPGALNLGAYRAELSLWAGWMLDPDVPIYLVLESDEILKEVVTLFIRTGYTRFGGYLAGGMSAWSNAGLPLQLLRQIPVHELQKDEDVLRLDVRSPDEWNDGHIPGARHVFLPELRDAKNHPEKNGPVAVYCDSGYRASLAASWLQAHGLTDVRSVPGSWKAWTKAGLPIVKEEE
ncbi:MAG: rhodanese-like domain-containing protein [Phycisphaerales bacterium]